MRLAPYLALMPVCVLASRAVADPCGMVPPISVDDNSSLVRTGDQQTYVFYKDGIETFVIRPAFKGKVEDFGMLIPFPNPPAVRKTPDDIFPHIQAAIDPPEVIVNLIPPPAPAAPGPGGGGGGGGDFGPGDGLQLAPDEVRAREEAGGMYEVAVLEAGSADALKRWMQDRQYKFPGGMDKVCQQYVEDGWCFVAVKTRVAGKAGVDPKPGMRDVNDKLPAGGEFTGSVQAMGFRFPSRELVVPMRLSAYNEGELHNIVYVLTDGPRRVRSIPEEYVVRQISGKELFRNVTGPLPVRVIGGQVSEISPWRTKRLLDERDPAPHNGHARVLFAGDLLTVASRRLSHPHEEAEKSLLNIGERLGLRDPRLDELHRQALKEVRENAVKDALAGLKKMTLTVLDGDFPRDVLASKNLQFALYSMPERRNGAGHHHALYKRPQRRSGGVLFRAPIKVKPQPRDFGPPPAPAAGGPPPPAPPRSTMADPAATGLAALALMMFGLAIIRRRAGRRIPKCCIV